MKKILLISLFISLSLFITAQTTKINNKLNENSILIIKNTDQNNKTVNKGYGFIIDSTGIGITLIQLLNDSFNINISTINNNECKFDKIIAYDEETGLVKFSIKRLPKQLFPSLRPDFSKSKIKESVLFLTKNQDSIVKSNGKIISFTDMSKFGRTMQISGTPSFSNNNGNALLNENGNVIGIIMYGLLENKSNLLAIDINRIKDIETLPDNLRKGKRLNFNGYYLKGIAAIEEKNYDEAINNFNKTIETNPEDYKAFLKRGETYMKSENFDAAMKDFMMVLRIKYNEDAAFYNIAEIYAKNQQYNPAVDYLTKAIEYNSKNKEAYKLRGETKIQVGSYEAALTDLNNAILIDSEYGEAYFLRGICKSIIKKKKDACDDLNKAKSLGVENIDNQINQICK